MLQYRTKHMYKHVAPCIKKEKLINGTTWSWNLNEMYAQGLDIQGIDVNNSKQ